MGIVSTANTNQHYVSRMLLRGFAAMDNPEQVWAFDKRTGKSFRVAVGKIAAEIGYYDLDGSATLDATMNQVDGAADSVITKIRSRKALSASSLEDRFVLAVFVVFQMLRTRGFQERSRHMIQMLTERIETKGGTLPPDWTQGLQTSSLRRDYLTSIPDFAREFLPQLLNKDLLLFKTDESTPFCISDNPVALSNTINPGDGIRGTLGLAVKGIEVYLPISRELTLAYLCPSIAEQYLQLSQHWRQLGGFAKEEVESYLQARSTGMAMMLNPENIRYQNSLQVISAERFVIAPSDNFIDAADIAKDHPSARLGPRMKMNTQDTES